MFEGDVRGILFILVGFGIVWGGLDSLDLFNWPQLGHTISTSKPVQEDRRVGDVSGLREFVEKIVLCFEGWSFGWILDWG